MNDYVLKVYNNCYGGGPPLLNEEARTYYNSLEATKDENLISTIERFGTHCTSKPCAEFGLVWCPKEYIDCYKIKTYDGLESPYICRKKLLNNLINKHFEQYDTIDKQTYDQLVEKSKNVELIFLDDMK